MTVNILIFHRDQLSPEFSSNRFKSICRVVFTAESRIQTHCWFHHPGLMAVNFHHVAYLEPMPSATYIIYKRKFLNQIASTHIILVSFSILMSNYSSRSILIFFIYFYFLRIQESMLMVDLSVLNQRKLKQKLLCFCQCYADAISHISYFYCSSMFGLFFSIN